jgi:HK97 family phage portal protein
MKTQLFTGYKGIRLEDLPEEAWRIVVGEGGQNAATKLYAAVSWLYRCVDVRAGAVANMPYEILSGDSVLMTNEDDAPDQTPWLEALPELLYRTEAALLLCGRAYWFRERNLMKTLDIRWLRPDSITPDIDENGLNGFKRRLGNRDIALEAEDLVYFWPPDWTVEIGPAENYPGKAALASAGVLHSMDKFLSGYFERGLIKATILTYGDGVVTPEEKSRVKEWWRRAMSGGKNSFTTEVVGNDLKTVVVGEGLKDLQNTALTAEQREAVCTALGVPQSKVTANAANYATKQGDDLSFIQDTVSPECRWIAAAINKQLLSPMGLRLAFKPDSLSIMQEDEEQRAQSLKTLVDAGMSLEMALDILGYDLPEGIDLREPKPEPPPMLPIPQAMPMPNGNGGMMDQERMEEERRFLRWAKKRTNPDVEQYESVVLSHSDKLALLEDGHAGDAPFLGWESYP